jgi:hypothetical protein
MAGDKTGEGPGRAEELKHDEKVAAPTDDRPKGEWLLAFWMAAWPRPTGRSTGDPCAKGVKAVESDHVRSARRTGAKESRLEVGGDERHRCKAHVCSTRACVMMGSGSVAGAGGPSGREAGPAVWRRLLPLLFPVIRPGLVGRLWRNAGGGTKGEQDWSAGHLARAETKRPRDQGLRLAGKRPSERAAKEELQQRLARTGGMAERTTKALIPGGSLDARRRWVGRRHWLTWKSRMAAVAARSYLLAGWLESQGGSRPSNQKPPISSRNEAQGACSIGDGAQCTGTATSAQKVSFSVVLSFWLGARILWKERAVHKRSNGGWLAGSCP